MNRSLSSKFNDQLELQSVIGALGYAPKPPSPGTPRYTLRKVEFVMAEAKKGPLAELVGEIVDLKKIKDALELLIQDPDPDLKDKGLRNAASIISAICKAANPKKDSGSAPEFDPTV